MPLNKVGHAQRASFYTVKGLATPYPSPTDNSRKEIHTDDQTQRITSATDRQPVVLDPDMHTYTSIRKVIDTPNDNVIEGRLNKSQFDTNMNTSNKNPILGQGTVFQEGELVVLTEKNAKVQRTRGKIHSIMVQLLPKKTFRSHAGHILLSNIINLRVGSICKTHNGTEMVCTRPTLEKYVELYLKRSATPTYPKDAMAIMFMLDISPGMRVLEAGSGSGALSLYLARCVGERGSVVSVEKREDHSLAARTNYSLWAKAHSFPDRIVDWHVGDMSADTEENIEALRPSEIIRAKKLSKELSDESFDGVALDMAEPGPSLATVARVLKPGRFLVCYLPNITQVLQTLSTVKIQNLNLQVVRTVECQMRNWTFEPNPRIVTKAMRLKEDLPEQIITVARPSHAQDTHTAFLVQFTKTA